LRSLSFRSVGVVIAAATLALAGLATLARADTPVDAPEPRLAEPAPDSAEPAPDSAEPPAPQADKPVRPMPLAHRPVSGFRSGKGWFLGGSLGIGSVAYAGLGISNDSETATFLDARLGGMLTERLALSAEFWSDGHRNEFDDSIAITQNCLGVGAIYWVTPHFWTKAGLGTARLTVYRNGSRQVSHQGLAYTAGAGYEIVSRTNLSLDLSLRLLMSSFETSFEDVSRSALSLHAGLNWY
jgi:hypothetical protein